MSETKKPFNFAGRVNCATRVCPVCGHSFHVPVTRPNKMLCSRDCEIIQANRARLAASKPPEHTCQWCGTMVEEGVNYCSVRCATQAGRAAKGLSPVVMPDTVPPTRQGVYFRDQKGHRIRIEIRGTCGGGTIRRYC